MCSVSGVVRWLSCFELHQTLDRAGIVHCADPASARRRNGALLYVKVRERDGFTVWGERNASGQVYSGPVAA